MIIPQVGSSELAVSNANMMADTVRLLVHLPDRVSMEVKPNGKRVWLTVYVDPDDIRKVIGK